MGGSLFKAWFSSPLSLSLTPPSPSGDLSGFTLLEGIDIPEGVNFLVHSLTWGTLQRALHLRVRRVCVCMINV